MRKIGIGLFALVFCFGAHGAAVVTSLDVEGDVVLFTTDEAKQASSPACVVTQDDPRWSLSVSSDAGRAMYSLLMTAMATKMPVNVETASDCGAVSGIERAKRVWMEATSAPPAQDDAQPFELVTVYEPVGFGSKRYQSWTRSTECHVSKTLKGPSGQNYMYVSGSSCRCQEGSSLVTLGFNDTRSDIVYQCVIEVKVPNYQ